MRPNPTTRGILLLGGCSLALLVASCANMEISSSEISSVLVQLLGIAILVWLVVLIA